MNQVCHLRQAEGTAGGEEAFEDLREFLAERNAAAALSLSDRKDEILTLHRLEVPSTLNVTLLSTNCIENVIRNCGRRVDFGEFVTMEICQNWGRPSGGRFQIPLRAIRYAHRPALLLKTRQANNYI